MSRFLYLHGFASGPDSAKGRYFRERFREFGLELEIPDLTEGDFKHLTISRELTVVERAAQGEPVCLIGSSLGGYVAALYAARHAEVERVLLLAPAFDFAELMLELVGPEQAREWERSGWLALQENGSEIWHGLIEDARQYDAFPATTQPVLIFHGSRDTDVPWALSKEFARRTPGVMLELVDSDHSLQDAVAKIWGATVVFFGLQS